MNKRRFTFIVCTVLVSAASMLTIHSCKDKDGDITIFTIEDDKQLGLQVSEEINGNPAEYPVLDENLYPEAYQHINRITNTILNSGEVQYKDEFAWEVKLIHDDSVLNAFATPGGYIYVYTGLIKFLESEDQLAGVMGHEIAHADKRHSTDQLTKAYGVSFLLQVLLGQDAGALAQVASGLLSLSFSRSAESQADEFSVIYLYPTEYDARGASGFFQKIIDAGQSGGTPAFLSTHPNPENRVADIVTKWSELGGKEGGTFESRYLDFKNSLP